MANISKDINDYLDHITEYSNQAIFNEYLAKWNDIVVPSGLGIIVDRIRQYGDALSLSQSLGDDQAQNLILSNGMMLLAGMQDAIVATGKSGYKRLLESLSHSDEDVGSIAALELASQDLGTSEAIPYLEKSLKNAKGTGFQMAISIALGRHNKYAAYSTLARKYVVRNDVQYKYLAESAIRSFEELSSNGALKRLKAEGEYVYNSREEAVNGSMFLLTFQNAMTLVMLNMASRGQVPKYFFSDWVY